MSLPSSATQDIDEAEVKSLVDDIFGWLGLIFLLGG